MVNEDLVGGIEVALSKGKNLKDIMMSYYNSGYKKQEIEEAAMIAQQRKSQTVQTTPSKTQQKTKSPPIKKTNQNQSKKNSEELAKPVQPQQKVSEYGKPPKKPKGKFIIILLIILLVLAGAVAISYFLFKEEAEAILSQLIG